MLPLNPTDYQACYFTITPPTHHHWSTETPCCSPAYQDQTPADPTNPLLASRELQQLDTPPTPAMVAAANLMQLQTSAAHGPPTRPRPVPQQNVLHVTSDDSLPSDSSPSSYQSGMMSPPEMARCSRCHRTTSVDVKTGKSNMVQYGLNLWYCNRCATMVGLINR
ncbi:hypothetical protein EJ03DRAFT_199787 [Teratosphaeria nubilosa]|uniref:Uncharacterized protein n=1 Tax=Teratosphaeria nubilosa TaxID=161662 RepID=A0A6G1KYI2_9PEZI|nr:hypothetical protein EJ03DRAFT_199787 [Teratosphaeria nubilosa]